MRRAFLALLLLVAACGQPPAPKQAATPPPNRTCALLAAHKGWDKALAAANERWDVPPATMLAVIRQESNFAPPRASAKQPLTPHGFAQATARTWAAYRRAAERPKADRNDFAASVDFVGWYFNETRARRNLSVGRIEAHYLAYSRGWEAKGQASAAARRNAARVAAFARTYEKDLAACPPR